MTGAEIFAVGTALVIAGGAAGIAVCEADKLPAVIGKLAKVLCVVVGGPSVLSIYKFIERFYKSVDQKACYEMKVGKVGFEKVGLKNC